MPITAIITIIEFLNTIIGFIAGIAAKKSADEKDLARLFKAVSKESINLGDLRARAASARDRLANRAKERSQNGRK